MRLPIALFALAMALVPVFGAKEGAKSAGKKADTSPKNQKAAPEERNTDEKAPADPLLNRPSVGFRLSGGRYFLDHSERIEARPPVISLFFNKNIPYIRKQLQFSFQFSYLREIPVKEENPLIEGLTINSHNFVLGAFFGWGFHLWKLAFTPRLGGGSVLQYVTVTGFRHEKVSNAIPVAAVGLDISHNVTSHLAIVLGSDGYFEFDSGDITLLTVLGLGVSYKL